MPYHNPLRLWLSAVMLVLCAAPCPAGEGAIDLTEVPPQGGRAVESYSGAPNEAGVLETYRLKLPEFREACYFSPDANWPAGANRTVPSVVEGDFSRMLKDGFAPYPTVGTPARQGSCAVLKLEDGDYLCLTPVVGRKAMSWLYVTDDGGLELRAGTLGTAAVSCDLPLLAWARSPDPYAAFRRAWSAAITSPAAADMAELRTNKSYPEPFRYLGWCSWEEYRKDIDSGLLQDAVQTLNESDVPVRWALIDDGWLQTKGGKLLDFGPNEKFPNGWGPVLEKRSDDGVRWMGLWINFCGFWRGVHPDNSLPKNIASELMEVTSGGLMPKGNPEAVRTFYRFYLQWVARTGFDFVKVDNQATSLRLYRGSANAVRASRLGKQVLERTCRRNLDALLNCMAHNALCTFTTPESAVTRCSIDYRVGNAAKARSHLHQSFQNTLWLGQTVWPDHDMFHSSDEASGRMMAVSKALAGTEITLDATLA